MDEEHIKQWHTIETEAMRVLRRGSTLGRCGVGRVIHMLVLPSFDAAEGWEVYRDVSDSSEKRYFVVFTCWNREADAEIFDTPVERLKHPRDLSPTIDSWQFAIDTGYMDDVLLRFSKISITPYQEDNYSGLDGTSYEVEFGNFFAGSTMVWWENGPSVWQEFTGFCKELLKEFHRLAEIAEKAGRQNKVAGK